ncbi:hypothetical protein H6F51_20365 [Cyanobacteria bacterium FACHB-DQ100]|nr:hypothetical protein [Cyanobacteria bacterium FACHB-DQ100]
MRIVKDIVQPAQKQGKEENRKLKSLQNATLHKATQTMLMAALTKRLDIDAKEKHGLETFLSAIGLADAAEKPKFYKPITSSLSPYFHNTP